MVLPRYVSNMTWLVADQLIGNIVGFFVLIYVARVLGPGEYGAYAYVFSLSLLFGSLSQIGLDGLIIRELTNKPDQQSQILSTALTLRFVAAILTASAIVAYGQMIGAHSAEERMLFQASAGVVLAGPIGAIVGSWFKARLSSVYPSIANLLGVVSGGVLKVGFAATGMGVVWIGVGQLLGTIITTFVALTLFLRVGGPSLSLRHATLLRAKEMIGESWKLLVGSTLAMIYMQIDITMLRLMIDSSAAGEYSVAARLVMITTVIAAALTTTVFPAMVRAYSASNSARYGALMQGTFGLLFLCAYILIAAFVTVGPSLLEFAFGEPYAGTRDVLVLLSFVLPFAFARMVITRWVLIERQGNYLIASEAFGASINVAMNFILIPVYGSVGAVVATLLSFFVTTFLCLLVSAAGRRLLTLMVGAFINPISPSIWMFRNKPRS